MIKFKFYGRIKKKYDKEFKLTVVELSLLRGKVKEVAEEYGIDPQMLSSWRSQYKNHKEIAFPGNGKKMQSLCGSCLEIAMMRAFLGLSHNPLLLHLPCLLIGLIQQL